MSNSVATISGREARRAARNALVLIIASFVSKGILFAWQIVLGNWLGPDDLGIYGTIVSLMAVTAPLANFGLGVILIRDVARRMDFIGRCWTAVLFIQTILALLAYVATVGAAIIGGYSPTIVAFTGIAALSLIVDMFGSMAHDLLLAQERMALTSAVEIAHILLRVGLASAAVLAGWGLTGVYAATIVTGMLRSLLLWGANLLAGIRPQMPLDSAIALSMVWNAAPLALNGVLAQVYQHADKLLTTAIIGERSTGYLTPAFVIHFGVIELINTTILIALFPLMSRYYGDGRQPIFGVITEKLTRFVFILSLPVALGLSIFAGDIMGLIYRADFAPSGGILRLLIWYTLLSMVGNALVQAMQVQNRQRRVLALRAIGLVVNITLNVILLVQFRDPRGAALASIIAESLVLTLLLAQFEAAGWQRRQAIVGLARVAFVGLIAGGVMLLAGTIHFVVGGLLGTAVYVAGVIYGGALAGDDWDVLYRLAESMPGGSVLMRGRNFLKHLTQRRKNAETESK